MMSRSRPRLPRRPARGILATLAALALAAGCNSGGSSASTASGTGSSAGAAPATIPAVAPGGIDTAKARELVAQGALVLDVREQSEWDEGHLPQARLFPVGEIDQHLAEIEQAAGGKDRPVVLYCRTGSRARAARRALEAAGFTNVVNGGGYRAMAQ